MPPDCIISDLKKFVSEACCEELESAVLDAKVEMSQDQEKKRESKAKKNKGDKNKTKKPSLGELKHVAVHLLKKLLKIIDENGGIKDVIWDSDNRRVS